MNRRERRKLKKEINIFSDVVNIIKQYFPQLIEKLENLTDTRHQSYVEYKMSVITITRLLGLLCGIKSMRETTEKFNTEETIENIANLLEIELEEIPHYDTINNVVVGDMVISIDSEFVENEDEEVEKQDCEIRAFYRMAERIKKEYPRLPIIISGDALYACEPVITRCKENEWEYILRLKEEKTIEFIWITSFKIREKNKEELVYFGRQRWKIENEGFNMQKNGTFVIEHIYSMNYNGMKAHYFFIQFVHTIRQLLEKGLKHIAELKMSIKEVSATLTQALTQTITNLTEHKKIQLRFEPD